MKTFRGPVRLTRHGGKSRYFYVRVYDDETRKQTWESTRCESLSAAREWLKVRRLEEATGRSTDDSESDPPPSFKEACEQWLAVKSETVSEKRHYDLEHLAKAFWIPALRRYPLRSLTSTELRKYLLKRKKGLLSRLGSPLSATSVNDDRKKLRIFFNWCIRQGWLEKNPVNGTESFSGEIKRRVRYLSLEEQDALLLACRTPAKAVVRAKRNAATRQDAHAEREDSFTQLSPPPPWLHLLVLTALYCGFRRKTLLLLQWMDIDTYAKQWSIPGAKMKSRRAYSAPIPAPVLATLEEYRCRMFERHGAARVAPDALIFSLAHGASVRRPFLDACQRAGVDISFHGLRGCFLNRCAELKIPIEIAMRLSDHSRLEVVLKHYREVRSAELAEAVATIEAQGVSAKTKKKRTARASKGKRKSS